MALNKNIGNYFGATPDRPYHLSVGGVIVNEENEVYCLYYPNIDSIKEVYVLPNKTAKPEETPQDTLIRGALQELGCKVKPVTFLGTHVIADTWWNELGTPIKIEKSVLFFLAIATKITPEIAQEANKSENREVKVKSFDFLIDSMTRLQLKDGMRDFNQSKVLIRAKNWILSHPDLVSKSL